MKKFLAAAAVLFAVAGTAFAVEAAVGFKGSLSVSGNTWAGQQATDASNKSKSGTNSRKNAIVGGGFDLFARLDFLDIGDDFGFNLGLQPELGFHFGWGANEKVTVGNTNVFETNFEYSTLDIPVLVNAGIKLGIARINLAIGPNFGIVLGKAKTKGTVLNSALNGQTEHEVLPFLMGMQVGAGLGLNFSEHHGLVFDVRAIFDTADLNIKAGNLEIPYTRRAGALMSLGYQYTF